MVFSSIVFLLIFLPVTVGLYYVPNIAGIVRRDKALSGADAILFKNIVLCAASLLFYAWGEPVNIVLMLISILFNWAIGIDMARNNSNEGMRKLLLLAAVVFDVGMLGFFKYSGFAVENIAAITGKEISFSAPTLPIGISFYTFQILSYVVDVYRRKTKAQRSLLNFALYISMFPQLIAGPIVQYSTIAKQLGRRRESLAKAAAGLDLFVIGLAKKVILANAAGSVFDELTASGMGSLTAVTAWTAVLFYSFQIYFDFSGYSDMAKGLGYIFGFEFPDNFRYPYIADSITEFWRRWHITLSSWFRDYVYIPLGGNRCSKARNIFNLFAVWALTGLWHGASWNFVFWGIYYFVLLVLEKFVFANLVERLPKVAKHILTLILIMIGWALFCCNGLSEVGQLFAGMFCLHGFADSLSAYHIFSNIIMLIIMGVFSTPLFSLRNFSNEKRWKQPLQTASTLVLFALSLVCLIGDTYNPFLYFRF